MTSEEEFYNSLVRLVKEKSEPAVEPAIKMVKIAVLVTGTMIVMQGVTVVLLWKLLLKGG